MRAKSNDRFVSEALDLAHGEPAKRSSGRSNRSRDSIKRFRFGCKTVVAADDLEPPWVGLELPKRRVQESALRRSRNPGQLDQRMRRRAARTPRLAGPPAAVATDGVQQRAYIPEQEVALTTMSCFAQRS